MVTNRHHEVARHGDSAVEQKKQGAGRRVTGACTARVKLEKGLLLVCAFFLSTSAELMASPEVAPPKSISFAYRITHPVFPLPHSVIERVRDQDGDALQPDESAAWDHDEPTPPDVGAKSRIPSQPELCREVASVAHAHNLPVPFFANLIWQESSFNSRTISRAGAQGIAQFMPKTAVQYGLENPFEPIHAIKVSARFLRQLREQFGNLGLAAAAYNAGPRRVSDWLKGRGGLPTETQNYVRKITGRPVENWIGADAQSLAEIEPMPAKAPCIEVAEAVLEQTRAVRVAKLMRELAAASAEPPLPAKDKLRGRDKREIQVAQAKAETKWARIKAERQAARLAKADRQAARLAKHKPSARELRKIRLAAKLLDRMEASRHAARATKMAAAKLAKAPLKPEKPAPAKTAALTASKPAVKPETPSTPHRVVRRTRVAYTNTDRLH